MTEQLQLPQIVSGGQTGAERAALDWAIRNGVKHGGWCPLGRRAEDGALDPRYKLTETESPGYRRRTIWNVRDSDATLIVNIGDLDGGSLETLKAAARLAKPCLVVQADRGPAEILDRQFIEWLNAKSIAKLNIAGPRESKRPGIYAATLDLLDRLLITFNRDDSR